MRRYAADVLASMGLWDGVSDYAICPLTGLDFAVANGEVDKANPEGGYVPGNLCLTSRAGNQERGKLQQWDASRDMARAEDYAADVARAAMTVDVTRKCHVVRVPSGADGMPPCERQSNVRTGPYGA